jgi:predicted TIM-barrel fold metal-dependent hydrolase
MMKIDIFNHVFPKKFFDKMVEVAPHQKDMGKRVRGVPMLYDLDERFRVMDRFDEYVQILSLASPPIETLAGPEVTPGLARLANDGMAELCRKHPQRFPGFTASLPLNNMDATLSEVNRAIKDLGARGVQVFTDVNGRCLDEPEFEPLFAEMARHDLPIWLHPSRDASMPDFVGEKRSKYEIWWTLGWPYDTSAAMARLVFGGLFDRYPKLKIITHHLGGMIPYFEGRVGPGWQQLGARTSDEDYTQILKKLKKPHIDYFHMFYADTALFGSEAGTKCGLSFFGEDKVVFASDAPFDPEKGPMYIRETIRVLENLGLTSAQKEKIYRGNAQKLLKLPAA